MKKAWSIAEYDALPSTRLTKFMYELLHRVVSLCSPFEWRAVASRVTASSVLREGTYFGSKKRPHVGSLVPSRTSLHAQGQAMPRLVGKLVSFIDGFRR